MNVFAIYQNPPDHPGHVVLAHFKLEGPPPIKDPTITICRSVEHARQLIPKKHPRGRRLDCVRRLPDDEPSLVETWL